MDQIRAGKLVFSTSANPIPGETQWSLYGSNFFPYGWRLERDLPLYRGSSDPEQREDDLLSWLPPFFVTYDSKTLFYYPGVGQTTPPALRPQEIIDIDLETPIVVKSESKKRKVKQEGESEERGRSRIKQEEITTPPESSLPSLERVPIPSLITPEIIPRESKRRLSEDLDLPPLIPPWSLPLQEDIGRQEESKAEAEPLGQEFDVGAIESENIDEGEETELEINDDLYTDFASQPTVEEQEEKDDEQETEVQENKLIPVVLHSSSIDPRIPARKGFVKQVAGQCVFEVAENLPLTLDQLRVVRFLNNHRVLACIWPTGSGKSLTAIVSQFCQAQLGVAVDFVTLMPKSLIPQWYNSISNTKLSMPENYTVLNIEGRPKWDEIDFIKNDSLRVAARKEKDIEELRELIKDVTEQDIKGDINQDVIQEIISSSLVPKETQERVYRKYLVVRNAQEKKQEGKQRRSRKSQKTTSSVLESKADEQRKLGAEAKHKQFKEICPSNVSFTIDEVHAYRSEKRSHVISKCANEKAKRVLLLTATPVVNTPEDFATIASILLGEPVDKNKNWMLNPAEFIDRFRCKISFLKESPERLKCYPCVRTILRIHRMQEDSDFYRRYHELEIKNWEELAKSPALVRWFLTNQNKTRPDEKVRFLQNLDKFFHGLRQLVEGHGGDLNPRAQALKGIILENQLQPSRTGQRRFSKGVVFMEYVDKGVNIMAEIMKKEFPELHILLLTGQQSSRGGAAAIEQIKKEYNEAPDNVLLILSKVGAQGLDLKNTGYFVYFPSWHEGFRKQARGRTIRYLSHTLPGTNLPNPNAVVRVYDVIISKPKHSDIQNYVNLWQFQFIPDSPLQGEYIPHDIPCKYPENVPRMEKNIPPSFLQKWEYAFKPQVSPIPSGLKTTRACFETPLEDVKAEVKTSEEEEDEDIIPLQTPRPSERKIPAREAEQIKVESGILLRPLPLPPLKTTVRNELEHKPEPLKKKGKKLYPNRPPVGPLRKRELPLTSREIDEMKKLLFSLPSIDERLWIRSYQKEMYMNCLMELCEAASIENNLACEECIDIMTDQLLDLAQTKLKHPHAKRSQQCGVP